MTSIPEIARAMEEVLSTTAEATARPSGFVQRKSKLSGALFAKTTVLGWLAKPDARLSDLTQVADAFGAKISPQGLDERFTPQAATFLEGLLEAAVGHVVAAEPVSIPVLQRFNGVILQDSSTIGLPEALAKRWPGCGNASHPSDQSAALKLAVRLDVLNGTLYGPLLEVGRCQDRNCRLQVSPLPKRALRLADLGFFNLGVFQALDAHGSYYLSRLHVQTAVLDLAGQRLDLLALLRGADEIDLAVRIGVKERLPVRLLAVRVPQEVADQRRRRLEAEARRRGQAVSKASLALADWTILVTNVPSALLSLQEALVLIRVRWQIELLFKLWKQHALVDEWRSQQPWRIACEVYAKLIGVVLQHWLFLLGCWTYRDRSLVKAAATVRAYGMMLVSALAGSIDIVLALTRISDALAAAPGINRRRQQPNTYQLLLDLTDAA